MALTLALPTTQAIITARDDFKKLPVPPLVWNDTVSSIFDRAHAVCDKSRSLIDKLVAEVLPGNATFANTIIVLELAATELLEVRFAIKFPLNCFGSGPTDST
jgi:hypothetical protein